MRYAVPGIYVEPEPKRIEPLSITNRCLTGFIGIAERGPLNEGIKITSFTEYQKIFGGFTKYGYLAYAVFGFFNSGGKECVITRVAHIDKHDESNSVSKAMYEFKDVEGELSFKLKAVTEGSWANNIQVKLWYLATNSAIIEKISEAYDWQQWIKVEDSDAYSLGDIVCIRTGFEKEYRKVVKISNNYLHFDKKFSNNYDLDQEEVFCELIRFNVIIVNGDYVEEYFHLSANKNNDRYFVNQINKESKIVQADEYKDLYMPEEIGFSNLYNGRDGILGLTAADFIGHYNGLNDYKGIGVFESIPDISVIAAPDLAVFEEVVYKNKKDAHQEIFAVQAAMVNQCERLSTRFAVLDLPDIENTVEMIDWRNKFDTKVAALYYPKIQIINPEDMTSLTSLIVPPSGHIAGVYALCDAEAGIFRAPANKLLKGAVGLKRTVDNDEYEITYNKELNCLKYFPGHGIKIWGARTLSSDIEWRYINVRRTFSAIKEAIKEGMGWAVFEPNNRNLRKRLVRHITAFLLELWRSGYMSGVTPEDGFFVKCNDELNPPEEVDAGRVNVEIGIAIAKPAEFLVMTFKSNSEDMVVVGEEK